MSDEETLPDFLINASIHEEQTNREGWAFSAPVRFNEDKITFSRLTLLGNKKATLTVSICLAHLHYILKDCILPEDGWTYDSPIEDKRTVTREATQTEKSGREKTDSAKTNYGIDTSVSPTDAKLEPKLNQETNKTDRSSGNVEHTIKDVYGKTVHSISAAGNEAKPRWTIEGPKDSPASSPQCLKGVVFQDGVFAFAHITGANPSIRIEVEIPQGGLMVCDEDHVFSSANKTKLGKLLFKKRFIDKKFELAAIDVISTSDSNHD